MGVRDGCGLEGRGARKCLRTKRLERVKYSFKSCDWERRGPQMNKDKGML